VPSFRVVCANPLEHSEGIKGLFLAHEVPDFPAFFDRAYPSVVRDGGKSWIGFDDEGRVVAHIARFPRRFVLGKHTVVGGLLADLMTAKSHRTLFPGLMLVRQLTAQSQAEGDVDFLYGAPNDLASVLFKGTKFTTVGQLRRFVYPLAGTRWYTDAAVRVWHALLRIRDWRHRAELVEHSAGRFDAAAFERPPGELPALRPIRPPELYGYRLAGYPSEADHWFTVHRHADSSAASAALLVRGGRSADGNATLVSLSRDPSMSLSAIVPALAAALRRAGYRRLSVTTLSGTPLARELTRAGFVSRPDTRAVVARALTPLGADAIESATSWEITDLDSDR
jgi:hypothetical protein